MLALNYSKVILNIIITLKEFKKITKDPFPVPLALG